MKNLQLSLTTNWFNLTKAGIKKEDYREINNHWARRLLQINFTQEEFESGLVDELIDELRELNSSNWKGDLNSCLDFYGCKFKVFNHNIMTLGYPKSTDSDRILRLEHKGIEISTGNPDWGAEYGELYFVIKHGEIL